MGKKDGELWDDSSLIDAFNDAIYSYKMMCGMKQIDDEVQILDTAADVFADEEDVKRQ